MTSPQTTGRTQSAGTPTGTPTGTSTGTPTGTKVRIHSFLGGLACLCFVVQQFLLPVHLLLHEHTFNGFSEVHAHSHGVDSHSHESDCEAPVDTLSDEPGLAGSEHSHPVEDHTGETPEPGLNPAWLLNQIALVDLGSAFEFRPLPFRELVAASSGPPRAPPALGASVGLRAPPRPA